MSQCKHQTDCRHQSYNPSPWDLHFSLIRSWLNESTSSLDVHRFSETNIVIAQERCLGMGWHYKHLPMKQEVLIKRRQCTCWSGEFWSISICSWRCKAAKGCIHFSAYLVSAWTYCCSADLSYCRNLYSISAPVSLTILLVTCLMMDVPVHVLILTSPLGKTCIILTLGQTSVAVHF